MNRSNIRRKYYRGNSNTSDYAQVQKMKSSMADEYAVRSVLIQLNGSPIFLYSLILLFQLPGVSRCDPEP
jgi:hypothetical protein